MGEHAFEADRVHRDVRAMATGSLLITRNVMIGSRRTSLRMELETWRAFDEICRREGLTPNDLCERIERLRGSGSRTSTVRTFVLAYFREAFSHYVRVSGQPPGRLLDETLPA